jgi:hypothetical protein
LSLNVGVVHLMPMVVYCLSLIVVCLKYSCDEHHGCVLLISRGDESQVCCYFYTHAHTLIKKKKKLKKKFAPITGMVVVTRKVFTRALSISHFPADVTSSVPPSKR